MRTSVEYVDELGIWPTPFQQEIRELEWALKFGLASELNRAELFKKGRFAPLAAGKYHLIMSARMRVHLTKGATVGARLAREEIRHALHQNRTLVFECPTNRMPRDRDWFIVQGGDDERRKALREPIRYTRERADVTPTGRRAKETGTMNRNIAQAIAVSGLTGTVCVAYDVPGHFVANQHILGKFDPTAAPGDYIGRYGHGFGLPKDFDTNVGQAESKVPDAEHANRGNLFGERMTFSRSGSGPKLDDDVAQGLGLPVGYVLTETDQADLRFCADFSNRVFFPLFASPAPVAPGTVAEHSVDVRPAEVVVISDAVRATAAAMINWLPPTAIARRTRLQELANTVGASHHGIGYTK